MDDSSNIGIGINTPLEKLHVNGGILIGNTIQVQANNGTIRWNGADFQGKKNGDWVSFTGIGLQGQQGVIGPRGIVGYPGGDSNWPKTDNNNLYYTDGNVGIGITGGQNSEKLMIRANSISDPALNIYGKTQVSGNIIPEVNHTYDLGSSTKGWDNVYMNTAVVSKGVQIGNADDVSPNGTIRYINNTFQVKTNNKWYYLVVGMEVE